MWEQLKSWMKKQQQSNWYNQAQIQIRKLNKVNKFFNIDE